jgi:hypothetical protein
VRDVRSRVIGWRMWNDELIESSNQFVPHPGPLPEGEGIAFADWL